MKVRSTSLSNGLEPVLLASDVTVPVTALLVGFEDATGGATGFALEEMLDIPMLPVSESNKPPTDGDALTTTSGSTTSPVIMSPIACATIDALREKKNKNNLVMSLEKLIHAIFHSQTPFHKHSSPFRPILRNQKLV